MSQIDDLVKAAKDGEWGKLDDEIPDLAKIKTIVNWAYHKGLRHSNDNVRDLAASILEKTEVLTPAMKEKLYYVMKDDSNRFARFRAACAIAAHDSKYHAAEVKAVLVDIAKKDKEVSDIAGGYLKKYPN